jgi:hypothetical protein
MFNIAPGHETSYLFSSPTDTQWATDVMAANAGKIITATNWQNLTFTDWAPAYGGSGSLGFNITSHSAVVHLVTDDIYLNLSFTQYGGGGVTNYTYQRSTAAAPLLAGDYNSNGTVDAADYALWRKYNNTSTTLANDPTPGTDATDYDVWRAHFGQPPGNGAAVNANAAVPEPTTLVLLMFAAAGCVSVDAGPHRKSQ